MPTKRRDPESLRAAIRRRVAERQLTTYRLAIDLDGEVSRKMLDRYLSGANDLTSEKVDALLRLLDLRVSNA